MKTQEKHKRGLLRMLAVLLLTFAAAVGNVSWAQTAYTASLTDTPKEDDNPVVVQRFPAADIAEALGLADVDALKDLINNGDNLYLVQPDRETNQYTGGRNEFWMNEVNEIDGYYEWTTRWLAGLKFDESESAVLLYARQRYSWGYFYWITTPIDFSATLVLRNGDNSVAFDVNYTVTPTRPKPVPQAVALSSITQETQEFYLYNVRMQKFLTQGEAYGTQAVVADQGRPVRVYKSGQNYRFFVNKTSGVGDWLFRAMNSDGVGTFSCFVDGNESEGSNRYWRVTTDGDAFTVTVPSDYYKITDEASLPDDGSTYYLACNKYHQTNHDVWETGFKVTYGVWFDETELTDKARWQAVTAEAYEEYQAELERYMAFLNLENAIRNAKAVNMNVTAAQAIYDDENSPLNFINAAIDALTLDFNIDGVNYRVTDGTKKEAKVANNSWGKLSGNLVIPETVTFNKTTYTVTRIENCRDNPGLTSVVLPSTIKNLGAQVFANCKGLESVTLNEGLEGFNFHPFENCTSLTTVHIPSTVWDIFYEGAFAGCSNIEYFTVAENSPYNKEYEGAIYKKDLTELYHYPGKKEYFSIPSSVHTIGTVAMCANSTMETLVVPNTVRRIDPNAFEHMGKLKKIVIPSSVTSMSIGVFDDTPMLEEFYLESPLNLDNTTDANPGGTTKEYTNCTLYVPKGKKAEFEASEFYDTQYSTFKDIVEVGPEHFLANTIIANATTIIPGNDIVMPVKIRNSVAVKEVTFSFKQPVGVSVADIALGESMEGMRIEREYDSRNNRYEVCVKSLAGQQNSIAAKGEVALAYITLSATETAAAGERTIEWSNITLVTTENVDMPVDNTTSTLFVRKIKPGDDVTDLMANPTFSDKYVGEPSYEGNRAGFNGWTLAYDESRNDKPNVRNNVPESYRNQVSVSQTVEGIPAGLYRLDAQGYRRTEGVDMFDIEAYMTNGTQQTTASINVGDTKSYVPDYWAGGVENLNDIAPGLTSGYQRVTYGGKTFYAANNQSTVSHWFEKGYYKVSAIGESTDGTLEVGFENTDGNSWFIWNNNPKLTYLGQAFMYGNDMTVAPGQRFKLPLLMRNIGDIAGMQFAITLPEGMEFEGCEAGERAAGLINVNYNLVDGTYLFAVTPTGLETIAGKDGVVLNLKIKASSEIANGDYTARITDVRFTEESLAELISADSEIGITVSESVVMLGDVNDDGNVTNSDAVSVIYHVLKKDVKSFNKLAADVNNDGEVTNSDAIAIVYHTIKKITEWPDASSNRAAAPARVASRAAADYAITLGNITVPAGATEVELPVCVANANELAGFFFEVALPQGVTITGYNATSRATGMMINGNYELGLFSIVPGGDYSILPGEGAVLNVLLSIDPEVEPGDYTMTLKGAYVTDTELREFKVPEATATMTITEPEAPVEYEDFQFYAKNVKVEEGSNTATLDVRLYNSETIKNFSLDIVLPAGVTVNYDDAEDDYNIIATDRLLADLEYEINDNVISIEYTSPKRKSVAADDDVVFSIVLDVNAAPGEYDFVFNNQVIDDEDSPAFTGKLIVKGGESAVVNLVHDGTPYTNATRRDNVTVTYTRTFAHTAWQALYVPFDMDYDDWADLGEVAVLTNVGGTAAEPQLNWTKVESGVLKANTPCIFKPKADGQMVITSENTVLEAAESESVSKTANGATYTLTGIYEKKTDMATSKAYGLTKGEFRQTTSDSKTLNPYLVFLTIDTPNNAPARVLNLVDGEATSVNGIGIESDAESMYDLSGRPIRNGYGIVIKNGKKVLINK